ncbi:MAG: oligoribonuclease NrnB/cAMP/cGMP phosphodiesterase (DHH superfamily) [bacterium]|jgi:oligoribonuclease NrnB/cAMP/cGMP phosphodiesterase (DHH superfamily)
MAESTTMVWYHANCPDGFGAAWAAWKRFGDNASYFPTHHGENLPHFDENTTIYMVDFSVKKSVMEEVCQTAHQVIVIDHHKSAVEDLIWNESKQPENLDLHFDMDHSGAVLTWEFFHQEPTPLLLKYIEDRDLWRFQLESSSAVSAWFQSIQSDNFQIFGELVDILSEETQKNTAIIEGNAILRYITLQAEKIASLAHLVKLDGHEVWCVNSSMFASEVGAILAEKGPFGIVWRAKGGKKIFSLRGNDKVDVSEIASQFGGGGHKNAAGFQTLLHESPYQEI